MICRLVEQYLYEDAQWLIRMVENLLSITRISGEQTAISKEYEAAEEILAASVHKFEKRFKSNIRIAVEVPQEVVLVPMDATLIQQVLLNLMENAVLHLSLIHILCCTKRYRTGGAVWLWPWPRRCSTPSA